MTLPAPFYDDGKVTIYNSDCRDILPEIETKAVALVLTDPPYGIKLDTAYAHNGRGLARDRDPSLDNSFALAESNDFPPVAGDDEPFDPAHLMRFKRIILFGANHYADKLPPSGGWIVWDKVDGLKSKRSFGFCDGSDAELAWTNLGGAVRILRHRWMGLLKASEREKRRVHPTQKPVAMMVQLIEHYSQPGDLILDPYMGSGPVAAACQKTGRRYIGMELSEHYCSVAVQRLQQQVLPLFGEPASRAGYLDSEVA